MQNMAEYCQHRALTAVHPLSAQARILLAGCHRAYGHRYRTCLFGLKWDSAAVQAYTDRDWEYIMALMIYKYLLHFSLSCTQIKRKKSLTGKYCRTLSLLTPGGGAPTQRTPLMGTRRPCRSSAGPGVYPSACGTCCAHTTPRPQLLLVGAA